MAAVKDLVSVYCTSFHTSYRPAWLPVESKDTLPISTQSQSLRLKAAAVHRLYLSDCAKCVHVCVCVIVHVLYVHVRMYVCMYICVYACMYVCMYVCVYVIMYACMCVCVCVCVCVWSINRFCTDMTQGGCPFCLLLPLLIRLPY